MKKISALSFAGFAILLLIGLSAVNVNDAIEIGPDDENAKDRMRWGFKGAAEPTRPPLSNMFLTLLNALDVPASQFSDSTSTFSQITK